MCTKGILLLMLNIFLNCFSDAFSLRKQSRKQWRVTMGLGVEHLVDCAENPQWGAALENTGLCMQKTIPDIAGSLVVDLLSQAVTIGLLVATYYSFKRSSSRALDESDNDSRSELDDVDIEGRRCPQCRGLGYFRWSVDGATCDLCGGSGRLKFSRRKESEFDLPEAARDMWSSDDA